ncbi:hypothetical protein E3N88_19712 [Mikania micrantha]|uniref:Ty3 transposon capsid-like protein domain-containing protein n=1 Tax=Mikania micrantha TaxID=192012 RepID=A0A5N6NP44_9ASTR|nr:hypothetical protein E3N88_19712 [Mikania micrantha]
METRTQNTRLDTHDQQIKQLQLDVAEIKQMIADDRNESSEFRKVMLSWVKQLEKRPASPNGTGPHVEDPFHTPPPFHPHPPPLPWAVKKVKLPEFSGFDPQGWIKKANLYFDINQTPDELRLKLAQLSMTGVAQHWFTVVTQIHDEMSWAEFQRELLQRFSGLEIHNPFEQLATIKQSSSILDYIDDFEYLLSLVPRLPESQSIGYFVAGLKEDVKQWVRLHRPQSRLDAIYLAKDVEAMLRPQAMNSTLSRYRYADYGGIPTVVSQSNQSGGVRGEVKTTHPTSRSFSSSNFLSKGESGVKSGGLGSSSSNSSTRDKSVRTLSRTEWEERRKKGLCYRCGQLYGPTHRCPEGKLRVLLLGEDEEIADLGEQLLMTVLPSSSVAQEFDPPDGSCQVLEIMASCNQLCGHQTLQLDGILLGIPICLLVDSGATHNFISKRLVSALAIPFTTIDGIKIRLGDGHVVMVTTQCQQLSVQIGPCTFVINALVFDTGSLDLILGMEWLQSLGPVTHDWKNAWMQFTFHDSRVVLQGGGTNTHSNASLQTWLRKESKPQLTVINLLASMMTVSNSHSNSLSSSQQQSLSVLLNDFTSIFQIPSSLPPSRSYDHQIILSTSDPIVVRPYRYPHIQKNEIEKQVKELRKNLKTHIDMVAAKADNVRNDHWKQQESISMLHLS